MTNFSVFSIPKKVIPLRLPNPKKWETYDAECNRAEIILDDNVLDRILSFSKTNLFRDEKKYTTHRVKYSLKNENQDFYSIDEHQDSCKFTLIVYLDKSSKVRDEFWVGNHQIEENLWSRNNNTYRCLVFWGNSLHKGKIFGKGHRDILCFFCD